jgi:hypothetical protein
VYRISDHHWVTPMADYSADISQRWVVSYRTAEHLIDVRRERGEVGLEIVYVGEERTGENYDDKGNWIGPVANENGWTP